MKNGRIYFVSDDNAISRPGGPRLVEALEELSYFIHPEAYGYNFQPVSCPVELSSFLPTFVLIRSIFQKEF
ncbi:hypothetical protein [Thermococcus peptonophilus]|uniref:hypothetical protein n=1 Tax=Thermococcus peptonophilus TaxID=53952 RepID=UPI000AE72B31